MNKKSSLLLLLICLWISSCVVPFELNIESQLKLLTVDATLTDGAEEQIFTLSESVNYNGSAYASPILKATVEILVNGIEKVALLEKGAGKYALPSTFKTKSGNIYKLIFSKADGTKYESSEDKLITVPEIMSIRSEFKLNGIEKGNSFDPAHYIYLDTQDPAQDQNNYLWTWRLWEKQNICETCYGGRYFLTPPPARCRTERGLEGSYFDYHCTGDCWEILPSNDLNVLSDVYSNGSLIKNRLVAKIPLYSFNGALIEVKQQTISANAFRYFKLLADLIQNNGTLVDTPPAAIVGNIKNVTNPEEIITGFFMATSVRTMKYWIDRKDAYDKGLRPIGILNHPLNLDPGGAFGPPTAACILSQTRTPTKPKGWVN